MPGAWIYDDGPIEAVVNRDFATAASSIDSGSPGRKAASQLGRALANYRAYVPLEDFEAATKKLSKEVVPVKRKCLIDYVPSPVLGPASASDAASALSGASRPLPAPPAPAPTPPLPPVEAPAAPAAVASRSAAASVEPSPRRLRRVQLTRATPRSASDSPMDVGVLEKVEVYVKKVASNDNGISHNSWHEDAPKVASRDLRPYASRDVRHAREKNSTCRNRLNELLALPHVRIGASDKHASKAFEAVPAQNLRVV